MVEQIIMYKDKEDKIHSTFQKAERADRLIDLKNIFKDCGVLDEDEIDWVIKILLDNYDFVRKCLED